MSCSPQGVLALAALEAARRMGSWTIGVRIASPRRELPEPVRQVA